MPKKMMQVSGQRLSEIRSGLAVLKEKRLPSSDAESMVASLWQMLRPAFDMYDDIVKKLQKLGSEIQECDDEEVRKELDRELREKAEGLATGMFSIPIPKTKLQVQHLPKAHKGRDGDENPAGNAAVMIALGDEFFEFPNPCVEDPE